MSIRQFLNEKPQLGALSAGVLVIIALLVVYLTSSRNTGPIIPAYFFDLNTQKLVLTTANTASPAGGSGTYTYGDGEAGSLVRINVYACGDQEVLLEEGMSLEDVGNAGGKVLSLQRVPLNVLSAIKRVLEKDNPTKEDHAVYNRDPALISLPEAPYKWVSRDSPEGRSINARVRDFCPGSKTRLVSQ